MPATLPLRLAMAPAIMSSGMNQAVMQHGKLAYVDPAVDSAARGSGAVFYWNGSDATPTKLNLVAEEINLAPDGTALVACQANQRTLWHNGTTTNLPDGPCNALAWSATGRLAINRPQGEGVIVEPDGGVREAQIASDAMLVGWDGQLLFFFAPTAANQWQLYQYDANTTDPARPIGQPVNATIVAPELVLTR